MTGTHVVIDRRFCGPPDSANGGYTCGVLARHFDGPAEVTLRRPPPLERALDVVDGEDGKVLLVDDVEVVAEAAPARADLGFAVPAPPSVEEARKAGARCHFLVHPEAHGFPTCFVCGPSRAPGDGLRILVGPLEGRDVSADVWIPDAGLGGSDGFARTEVVWAALDCPSGLGAIDLDAEAEGAAFLLGRLAVRILGPVTTGEPHVVIGWRIAQEGRKLFGGSALFSADGRLLAVGRATWIRVAM